MVNLLRKFEFFLDTGCRSPFYNSCRPIMRQIVTLGEQLAASVPCYELSFVPDRSIVEFVKTLPQDQ